MQHAVYAKGLTAPLMALVACNNASDTDTHAPCTENYIFRGSTYTSYTYYVLTVSCRTELSIQGKLSLVKAINIPGQLGRVK